MNASKTALKISKTIVDIVIIIALLIAGLYAGYALWDNYRVYAEADNIQSDLLKFKPDLTTNDRRKSIRKSFSELCAINPDVCAWLTVDNTNIDYPVLQGKDNFSYINTDIYGDFSLAGSIFLDSRNSRDFSDPYLIVYGHHIANGRMFGDLDKFKEKTFFDKNKTGTLVTPDKTFKLEIFAVLVIGDSDKMIFTPVNNTDVNKIVRHAENVALHKDDAEIRKICSQAETSQILAMSTCSSDFTDARTVVLALMVPQK